MKRFYTRDTVGRPCPVCKIRMPLSLLNAGIYVHPTCADPETPPAEKGQADA